jgi:hypothetical protein
LWGLILGLATLSRTMVLGLLAALGLTLVMQLIVRRVGWRQVANLGAGLVVAFLVAFSWYSASWHQVAQYLLNYGYGVNAAGYGAGHSIWSTTWWTTRFTAGTSTEVLFPTALAMLICAVFGVVGFVGRRYVRSQRRLGPPEDQAPKPPRFAWLAGGTATVAVFLVISYLLLSSTRNTGSGFNLPLVPAAVILLVAVASRVPRVAWPVCVTACGLAAAFSLVAQSSLLPGNSLVTRTVSFGPVNMPLFNSEGNLLVYADAVFEGCSARDLCVRPGAAPASTEGFMRKWLPGANRAASIIETDSLSRGRLPVVFFAVQDPFFNTNTVDLAYQMAYHEGLPTGLLRLPSMAGESLVRQLEMPQLGMPNLVIAGPASSATAAKNFSPLTDEGATERALRAAGFTPIDHLRLPDGRVMTFWWIDRGPAVPPGGAAGG